MHDCEAWSLLGGGTIARLERDGGAIDVSVESPLVDNRVIRLRLVGCSELSYRPDAWPVQDYERPSIEDLGEIAGAQLRIVETTCRSGTSFVQTQLGWLRVACDGVEIALDNGARLGLEELRAIVHAWWSESRGELAATHPAILAALEARSLRATLDPLIAAWRVARTSELADAIAIVDERTRGAPPALFDGAAEAWCASWSREPGAALAELARCARSTWDTPADDYGRERVVGARCATWLEIARAVGALRGAAPDPRIGRGIESTLRSPSDHWFRYDDSGFGASPRPGHPPSFADHALALLDEHADAGTAARLDDEAEMVSIEADCNGAEMAGALRELADVLAKRGTDVPLDPMASIGLRSRPLVR